MILKEIWNGWKNVFFENEASEKLANDRIKICNTCSTKGKFVCKKSKGGCGCPIVSLIRSIDSKCKKGKW